MKKKEKTKSFSWFFAFLIAICQVLLEGREARRQLCAPLNLHLDHMLVFAIWDSRLARGVFRNLSFPLAISVPVTVCFILRESGDAAEVGRTTCILLSLNAESSPYWSKLIK
jgi:hypothetical protein